MPTYVPAWRHGGPVWAVHGLARSLSRRGHGVAVFTTNVHGRGELSVPCSSPVDVDGVSVRYFPVTFPRRLYRSPGLGAALRGEIRSTDVVHLHSLFLWPTLKAARVAQQEKTPYLVSPRGMLVPELFAHGWLRKQLWFRLFERKTLEKAARILVTSELEDVAVHRFPLRLPPTVVVPNGIDLEAFQREWQGELAEPIRRAMTHRPMLLFLGRLSWKKNLDKIIEALPMVKRATLVVAGPDDEGITPRLLRLAEAVGVGRRVCFVGPVGEREKVALLRTAELLVLPSLSENFANVVLEALAASCPCLLSPGVGLSPTVVEGGAGAVVEPVPLQLGAAMRDLLGDRRRLEAMRLAARPLAERYAWPTVAARVEAIYHEMVREVSRVPQ